MAVTRQSLIVDARLALGGAIKQRDVKTVIAALDLIQALGGDKFTEQDQAAIALIAEADAKETALYRHFNHAGTLLYVGISLKVITRTMQHRRVAPWFNQITRIEIEWFGSHSAAQAGEQAAIQREKPLYNTTFNKENNRGSEKRKTRAVRASHSKRQKPR